MKDMQKMRLPKIFMLIALFIISISSSVACGGINYKKAYGETGFSEAEADLRNLKIIVDAKIKYGDFKGKFVEFYPSNDVEIYYILTGYTYDYAVSLEIMLFLRKTKPAEDYRIYASHKSEKSVYFTHSKMTGVIEITKSTRDLELRGYKVVKKDGGIIYLVGP